MRILITGSRDWIDEEAIRQSMSIAVKYLNSKRTGKGLPEISDMSDITLIHGTAKGADVLAGEVAKDLGMLIEEHPADWAKHNNDCPDVKPPYPSCWQGKERCSRAGHRRNQEMIDSGADVILAFILDESPGATGCLNSARKGHMPSIVTKENSGSPQVMIASLPGFDRDGVKLDTLF